MHTIHKHRQVTILIAEDDDGHAELIRELLEETCVNNPLRRFRDGQEVVDFLKEDANHLREEGYLLLLDIRMPRMDGVQVLEYIKSDCRWKTMPVIMLTTTDDPREMQKCYELGCNCYVTKPVGFEPFAAALRKLGLFLMILQVPTVGEG